jgi:hypothetical protein
MRVLLVLVMSWIVVWPPLRAGANPGDLISLEVIPVSITDVRIRAQNDEILGADGLDTASASGSFSTPAGFVGSASAEWEVLGDRVRITFSATVDSLTNVQPGDLVAQANITADVFAPDRVPYPLQPILTDFVNATDSASGVGFGDQGILARIDFPSVCCDPDVEGVPEGGFGLALTGNPARITFEVRVSRRFDGVGASGIFEATAELRFRTVEGTEVGDFNLDGIVDLKDTVISRRVLAGEPVP